MANNCSCFERNIKHEVELLARNEARRLIESNLILVKELDCSNKIFYRVLKHRPGCKKHSDGGLKLKQLLQNKNNIMEPVSYND